MPVQNFRILIAPAVVLYFTIRNPDLPVTAGFNIQTAALTRVMTMTTQGKEQPELSDEELVKGIAALARLDFEPDEIESYAAQMRSILDYFEELKQINLEGINPTVQINPLEIQLASDEVGEGIPRNDVLVLSVRHRGDFISVPRIVNPEDEAAAGA